MVNHLDTQNRLTRSSKGSRGRGAVPSASGRISPAATSSRYLLDGAIAAFGHIEILVNNAAIAPLTPIAQATEEQINAVLDVNVKGTVFGCQLAAERLADDGRIINISSSTMGLALPGYRIYDMTIGAIEQLTRIPWSGERWIGLRQSGLEVHADRAAAGDDRAGRWPRW